MNEKKICFITCVNDEEMYAESLYYIQSLEVPGGFSVETVWVKDAPGIAQAYNAVLKGNDAKYKVYLHQDVFIINKNFINDILDIFTVNPHVGMLGVAGAKNIPANGVWWESPNKYGKVYDSHTGKMELLNFTEFEMPYQEVDGIDGLLMVTQYDVQWREDIFNGWHFYELSQSLEFKRAGYQVAVLRQDTPWCIHDCGKVNVSNGFDQYCKIFLTEYKNDLFSKDLYKWLGNENNILQAQKLVGMSQQTLQTYIFEAKNAMLAGEWEKAVSIVQEAGYFAFFHHPGIFFSIELEKILKCCAEKLDDICNISFNNTFENLDGKRRVLHILTEGYASGGHTRLAARWMENDKESIHAAVAVGNGSTMPQWLPDVAEQSGGWYMRLDQENLTICQRAKLLRKIAYSWADVVVLHHHPYDVVPAIAFGIDGGPPVIILNHSDHTFWLGVFTADIVANIRPLGHEVTVNRRGTHRSMILPIPLAAQATKYTRNSARKKLGVSEDKVLLLSVASAYKYMPCGDYNIFNILNDIVKKYSNVLVLIVGPSDEGAWNQLKRQTNGRVRAVGVQNDLDLVHCAADVYLNSLSIASLTASLEAGLRGLPIVYFDNVENTVAQTLRMDDISLLESASCCLSKLSCMNYEKQVERLIKKSSYRKMLGNNLSQIIKKDHIVEWNLYLHKIYHALPQTHSILKEYDKFAEMTEDDLVWAYLQYKTGLSYSYKNNNSGISIQKI